MLYCIIQNARVYARMSNWYQSSINTTNTTTVAHTLIFDTKTTAFSLSFFYKENLI